MSADRSPRTVRSKRKPALASKPLPSLASERDTFVGRRAELEELFELWESGARLVTIVGPGGAGKTRLAVHFCHRLRASASAPEELVFCDLSDARTAIDLLNGVAWSSDVTLPRRGDLAALTLHLAQVLARRGRMLLVLDNLEQLIEPARGILERFIQVAPELGLLVTTRERLRLPGERGIALGPLALPGPGVSAQEVLESDAVRLFLSRARAVHREFPASAEFAPVLGELVQKLEGLPLAIELCAARSGVLGPAELLGRIERRLETLVSRGAALPRHATLRAALDWSWQLLGPEEQRAIGQSSVFRGGFDLAAAEAVLDLEQPALDLLESLIDKSLIKISSGVRGERRYSMLESVVELCEERVDPAARAAAERRHARYYLDVAEQWAERALRTGDAHTRAVLELESHNLLAVHARALQARDPAQALAAALALEPLFARRGPLARFIELTTQAIEAGDGRADAPDALLRRALLARGIAKRSAGDPVGAIEDLERASHEASDRVAIWARSQLGVAHVVLQRRDLAERELELASGLADALGDEFASGQLHAAYAILRSTQERFDEAFDHDRKAAAHFRRSGASAEEGMMLFFRGYLHVEQGSLAEAEHYLSLGLTLLRDIGERRLEAHALADLGMLRIEQGRWQDASESIASALEIAENVGDDHSCGITHGYAGQNVLEQGDLEQSRQHFERSVQILSEVGDLRWVAHSRAALAAVESLLGRAVLGRELLDEACRELERTGKLDDLPVFEAWRAICEGQDAIDAFAGAEPKHTSFHWRAVRRVLESRRRHTRSDRPARRRLSIARDGSWFELDGERVSLARRGSLKRILQTLADAHVRDQAATTDVMALFEAGWPGQSIHADSAAHRVHVAMATLRKLGLGALLVTRSEGYALDPGVELALGDP